VTVTADDLRARIAGLSVWKSGGQRAPHKPLLLLYALARFTEGQRVFPFSEVEPALRDLLESFGPPRTHHYPQYPFWRLQNDRLWILDQAAGLVQRQSNSDPTLTSLRIVNPVGRFPEDVGRVLQDQPDLVAEIASSLLNAHFPASLHEDVLDAVGLDVTELVASPVARRLPRLRRDPAFRTAVLRAYGYRCAVCGFETRVGSALVGVDAAHVKWHQAGGPDKVVNGLALCALHHRLLDRGAFTLAAEGTSHFIVEVAESAHGGDGFSQWLLAFHGLPVARPVSPAYCIAEPSIAWHRREVFRGPGRTSEGVMAAQA
jgi:putative restriction endonuclease